MPFIEFLCSDPHLKEGRTPEHGPLMTRHEGKWALCQRGGTRRHVWAAIARADPNALRTREAQDNEESAAR